MIGIVIRRRGKTRNKKSRVSLLCCSTLKEIVKVEIDSEEETTTTAGTETMARSSMQIDSTDNEEEEEDEREMLDVKYCNAKSPVKEFLFPSLKDDNPEYQKKVFPSFLPY